MFEKEAEEIANKKLCSERICYNHCNFNSPKHHRCGEWHRIYECAKESAVLGYNKANEWHYPSKGELPKEDTAEKETIYLLWFGLDDSNYMTGVFSHGRFWCFDSGWYETNEVIAWKEIVLPKESE